MNLESFGPPSQDTGVCLVYGKVGLDLGSLGLEQGSTDEPDERGEKCRPIIVQCQFDATEGVERAVEGAISKREM